MKPPAIPRQLALNFQPGPVVYSAAVARLLLERSGIPAARAAALVSDAAARHGAHSIPEAVLRSMAGPGAIPAADPTRATRSLPSCARGTYTIRDQAEAARLSAWEVRAVCAAMRSAQDPEPFSEFDCVTAADFRAALRRVRGK